MRNVTRRLARIEQQVPTLPKLTANRQANTMLVANVYERYGSSVCFAWLVTNGVLDADAQAIVEAMDNVPNEP